MARARYFPLAKSAVRDFFAHDAMSQAAAVAFYTAMSFAPLVLLLVTVGGFLGESAKNDLIRFFEQQLGPRAAEVTDAVIQNAENRGSEEALWRWLLGTGLLLSSASGVFGQLQAALNRIWDVKAAPRLGVAAWIRKRLLSMGMVLAILFILLVALVVSAVIDHFLPRSERLAGRALVLGVSFLVSAVLFAAIFRVLPDVKIAWRDVWLGALVTAALFSTGKFVLSVYFEHGGVGESYGRAAGALIALLVWVYYSCIILFVGAEITRAYADARGARTPPEPHARKVRPPPGAPTARRRRGTSTR